MNSKHFSLPFPFNNNRGFPPHVHPNPHTSLTNKAHAHLLTTQNRKGRRRFLGDHADHSCHCSAAAAAAAAPAAVFRPPSARSCEYIMNIIREGEIEIEREREREREKDIDI